MKKIADIYVNIPVKSIVKAYSYLIPEEFSFVTPGWRVLVPFGGRNVEGFIVRIAEQEAAEELKSILDLVDQEPWFDEKMLRCAEWIAMFYLCSSAEAMRLFMPGKAGLTIKTVYHIAENGASGVFPRENALESKIYHAILAAKFVSIAELRKKFAGQVITGAIQQLLRRQVIVREYETKRRAVEKFAYHYTLKESLDETQLVAYIKRPAQMKLLRLLAERGALSSEELKIAKISSQTLRQLLDAGRVVKNERRVLRDSYRNVMETDQRQLILNEEQETALRRLADACGKMQFQRFLLYGITGSGKTQVYIEAAREVRAAERQVIVLVPEIALTSQIVKRFKQYFGEDVIVMHSRLSVSERNDAILRIRQGQAGVVIGARSAIFTPLGHIGLIIMDEEHDSSYKQDESPRYHTRDVAAKLAELHGAVLVLGSATPSLESYFDAKHGRAVLLPLTKRIGDIPLPEIQVVDMREELRMGRRNIISNALRDLIEEILKKREQMIILLNRRGFSTFVMCRSCGHVIACTQCTLPMVYHANGKLHCHYCDTTEASPDVCPKCDGRYIKYFGTGTERLEHELRQQFPAARLARMDRDTTGGKFSHAEILDGFEKRRYDILLGTQMVAKGHDIQNVTAVGIISADSSLNIPDFRSAERCFSLITQAAGRAGRGERPGKVVIQTYNPQHYAVCAGARQDYAAFYEEEAALRKQLFYPPYSVLVKLTVQSEHEENALSEAGRLAALLREMLPDGNWQIMGPAPALVSKLREMFRINLLIKADDLEPIQMFLRENNIYLRKDILIDVHPLHVM